jgi:hypothetical protein
MRPSSKNIGLFVGLYGSWLLISVLWAITLYQLQALILGLTLLVIQTPWLTPTGWNSSTLSGVVRCTTLLLGGLWLGLVIFTEQYLQDSVTEHRLLRNIGRICLIIALIYGLSALALFLLP